MKLTKYQTILIVAILATTAVTAAPLLNPDATGVNGNSWSENYDEMMNALLSEERVINSVDDKLWVPWYERSNQCTVEHLQDGSSCDATVNGTNNCMVTDEFSQVGILLGMHDDQERMDQFFNTVKAIDSDNGELPAWRVYNDGNTIQECKDGINGNCDTASDATARIIIALFTAGNNDAFDAARQEEYVEHAEDLAYDMVKYEVEETCRPTEHGETCNWLAAGSEAKRGGLSSTDFGYTGYYADAIIAMLQAHAHTGDEMFLDVADDFTRNYLQAAEFDGDFSVPPGRSFRWTNTSGTPHADCTNSCNPVKWDGADAPRAMGMCLADYYSDKMNHELPKLDTYCQEWGAEHMEDPEKAPIQYTPDGEPDEPRSGYFSQGLQSLFLTGYDTSLFDDTLRNAAGHYSPETETWDYTACFGVYHQAFPMRALGIGLGQTLDAIDLDIANDTISDPPVDNNTRDNTTQYRTLSDYPATCNLASCKKEEDTTSGDCRTVEFSSDHGDVSLLACVKGDNVELYRQSKPGTPFEACIGDGCVDELRGFATFPMETTESTDDQHEQHEQPVSTLPVSCSAEPFCSVESDTTEGTCRSVTFATTAGSIDMLACEKNRSVELYRQSNPDITFEACVGGACVDELRGFDSVALEQTVSNDSDSSDTGEESDSFTSVRSLPVNCDAVGACSVVSDSTEGDCRSVTFGTNAGDLDVLACEKGESVELYRQSNPDTTFEACMGDACVDEVRGFDSFEILQNTENTSQNSSDVGNNTKNSDETTEVTRDELRPVSALSLSCESEEQCSVQSDTTEGTCRSVTFATGAGNLDLLACEKNTTIELYRQSNPDTTFKACVAGACVDHVQGFAETQRQTIHTDDTQSTDTAQLDSANASINELPVTCGTDETCSVSNDTVSGVCRTVEFQTTDGPLVMLGCNKENGLEVYRQSAPDIAFEACMGSACITELRGYATV